MFASLVDAFPGSRVEHWRSHDGSREVGRIKPIPANVAVIDITHTSWPETVAHLAKGKTK